MTTVINPLTDAPFMEALLDLVIPPSKDGVMPGAGSLGLGGAVAAAIESDSRFGPPVSEGLSAIAESAAARNAGGLPALAPAERLEVIQGVLGAHPNLMTSVARYLYPAYYQHPRVLQGLGEPARPPFPEGFEIEPTDEHLLAKLHARRRTAPGHQPG